MRASYGESLIRVLCTLALLFVSSVADAGTPKEGPTYRYRLVVDLPIIATTGLVSIGWLLGGELAPPWCAVSRDVDPSGGCDKQTVNGFDRWAAGNYNTDWHLASDIVIYSAMALAAGTLIFDEGLENTLHDILVIAESVFVSMSITILSGLAARRPRPMVYGTKAPDEERLSGMQAISFPSGHVGTTMALSLATFSTVYARHPDSAFPWVVLGVSVAAGTFVGIGRVMSGNHFPSDVLVGAAIGASAGLLVPALHRPDEDLVSLAPWIGNGEAGLAFGGRF